MTPGDQLEAAFADVATWRQLEALLATLDLDLPPTVRFVFPEALADPPERIAVLPGSFNPLTRAHVELAAAARAAGLPLVVFALARRTVDKEQVTGAALEDRLLTLRLFCARHPGHAVAALNRGLYVEQAEAFRAALPGLDDLVFLIGFDKLVQIFDPAYYADRDAALDRLFARARFLVAPRGRHDARDLEALLARPENRRYADRVRFLPLPPSYRDLSATKARAALAAGRLDQADLPPESAAFVRATGAYQPGDRYAERLARLRGAAAE
jgi:nicotinic acid mononucleotide adenylyltransferase